MFDMCFLGVVIADASYFDGAFTVKLFKAYKTLKSFFMSKSILKLSLNNIQEKL
jgi:hypothetical protein